MNQPKRNRAGRTDEWEIAATRGHQAHVLFGLRQQGRFITNFALDFLASARSSGFNEAEPCWNPEWSREQSRVHFPTGLVSIPEGRTLQIGIVGLSPHPSPSPPSTSLQRRRQRRESWDSPSDSSNTELTVSSTDSLQPAIPPVSRSRRKKLRRAARVLGDPVPEVPSPEVPSPEVPSPEVPSPEVPSPEVPSPEVPSPEVPSPEVVSNPKYFLGGRHGDVTVRVASPAADSLQQPAPSPVQQPAPSPVQQPASSPVQQPAPNAAQPVFQPRHASCPGRHALSSRNPVRRHALSSRNPVRRQALSSRNPVRRQALSSRNPLRRQALSSRNPVRRPALSTRNPVRRQAPSSRNPVLKHFLSHETAHIVL
ncbi:uncharacterized protein LOC130427554 [Triplophysa dalaica]|uniref:uncharacterized protein LOC130427554 n=1 Tax=Triplophysa dalaica TaxID=1582913 RepID=UPI0024DFBCBD|nr:uncharacterized protein LOC130427554 [Triplophysa dalaica]